jgi:hypothetical protein
MADSFIKLSCTNCGAKLDVYEDMDRFACGYCGTEMMAQRRGGTVVLKAVVQAIEKVQIGTDKTAAELAIVRLEKEREKLNAELAEQTGTKDQQVGCSAVLVFILGGGGIGLALQGGGGVLVGIGLLVAAALLAKWIITPGGQRVVEKSRIAELERRIEEQKRKADA